MKFIQQANLKSKEMIFLFALFMFISVEAKAQDTFFVEKTIQQFMKEQNTPGVVVALYYQGRGRVISFGFADKESRTPVSSQTIFELGSITKVFTSTVLAMEVLDGKMNLNDPVAKYLPPLKNSKGMANVTLLTLATHASSLPRVLPQHSRYSLHPQKFLENWQPTYPIGTKYLYSNLGFGLLGYALSYTMQQSFSQMIQERITSPLMMTSTDVRIPDHLRDHDAQGYTAKGERAKKIPSQLWPGSGALHSTGDDMLKFLKANLGVRGPEKLLKAMKFTQNGFFRVNNYFTMALGWQRVKIKDVLLIDKNGGVSGFSSYMGMVPEKKIGLVILANKRKASVTRLGRSILIQLARKDKSSK